MVIDLIKRELTDFRHSIHKRFYGVNDNVVNEFHKLYYDMARFGGTWANTYWMGKHIQKCPLDCWIYQEILFEVKPDLIIETGTSRGGSALFLANMCDIIGKGEVVTIDIEKKDNLPTHPRITYLNGSSISPTIIKEIKRRVKDKKVLVILDSDHSAKHVYDELILYSPFVSKGSYIIVEDTNVNGHPVTANGDNDPMTAVDGFMAVCDKFDIDRTKEKFYLTFNPKGYLKRKL